MRHSKIDLTMNVYTDPRLLDVSAAMKSLPELPLDDHPFPEHESSVAQTVAQDTTIRDVLKPIQVNLDEYVEPRKNPAKHSVPRGLLRVANGIRTRGLRNHNPAL